MPVSEYIVQNCLAFVVLCLPSCFYNSLEHEGFLLSTMYYIRRIPYLFKVTPAHIVGSLDSRLPFCWVVVSSLLMSCKVCGTSIVKPLLYKFLVFTKPWF